MKRIFKHWFHKSKTQAEHQSQVLATKYAKSGLTHREAIEIVTKITAALEVDKLFKDNSMGLNDLSKHIAMDRYKVSQVMNEYLEKNFYSLLNHYRIKEAQDLLLSQPFLSVKAIMYEVGFNSKTSFYGAFKKETGLSPNDYRSLALQAS
ncbi:MULTISPECIES: helix-turn-helix domain-containing protein [Flavobacteriaceae]|uniref:helix-turn-helix domain-containing protein n=1 Tax=Flavobacteriaceae TaxID=49546 RepID=UPI0014920294|nr:MULTISPECIES: helix-turn-helix domain-containing protein [Allomuricauda]MDC6366519.1 helix-turn-helix domain-containing protein [Muricauda sp. AC10]